MSKRAAPNPDPDEERAALVDLVDLAKDVGGVASGAALGLLVGGPLGAIGGGAAGAAMGHAFKAGALEFKRRHFSRRQGARVGGVIAVAVEETLRRMAAGETPRDDGFFEESEPGRSPGDEVLERMLLIAKDEAEERKIAFLGRLIADIGFDPVVSREAANNLVRTAGELSFRQLVLLELFLPDPPHPFRATSYHGESVFPLDLIHLLDEIHDLVRRGLVSNGPELALDVPGVVPARVHTQGVGSQLMALGRNANAPAAMVEEIRRLLSPEYGAGAQAGA